MRSGCAGILKIEDRDVGAFGGKGLGNVTTKSAGGTGHQHVVWRKAHMAGPFQLLRVGRKDVVPDRHAQTWAVGDCQGAVDEREGLFKE